MEVRSEANKKLFAKAPSHITTLLFFFVLSIVIMTIDYRYKGLEFVRTWTSTPLYIVYLVADSPIKFYDWIKTFSLAKNHLVSSNQSLQHENMLLKEKNQKIQYIKNENERLRSLLKMRLRLPNNKAQIAEVINIKLNLTQNELVINKGLTDGVYIGQPVLNTQGVIGQITHVSLLTSTVLLITSPRHAIPIQISQNLYRSIAQGTGPQSNLNLKRVSPEVNLQPGYLVETSGLGGVFPPGYPVGTITRIKPKQQFLQVEVKPFAKDHQTREVLLIWPAIAGKNLDAKN